MNFIEAAKRARGGSGIIPVFEELVLPRTGMGPAPEPQKGGGDSPLPLSKESIVSCFTCHHYDGKGPAWPGMCRYFETIGEQAKEIDFNIVDPVHGCKCHQVNPLYLVAESKRIKLHGDDPGWISLDPLRQSVKRETTRKKPSPVALEWLKDHLQALRRNGWTGRELYRRNKSRGICWCVLWDAPFLKVYLHDNGVIELETVIAGRDIIQTARPMHRREQF